MKKIKLIALDLDGTLLDEAGSIPRENRDVLLRCNNKGIIIVLSSGRMTACITPFAEILGIDCPVIAYNGAMATTAKKDGREMIFHLPLQPEYGDYMIDYCAEHDFHLNFYFNDILYGRRSKRLEKYAAIYSTQTGAVFHFLNDLEQLKGKSPTKLILITDSENDDRSRTRNFQYGIFEKKFDGKVRLFKTNPEYLEFLHRDADKGAGLLHIASFYGIKRDEIIAFGDGENDIAMLKAAGTGVALANAKDTVKRSATHVAEWDNNSAGVARFLTRYL